MAATDREVADRQPSLAALTFRSVKRSRDFFQADHGFAPSTLDEA